MDSHDYYAVLGVGRNADGAGIKKAYLDQMKKYHPDVHANLGEDFEKLATERTKEIAEAYSVLGNPQKRASYDEWLDERLDEERAEHTRQREQAERKQREDQRAQEERKRQEQKRRQDRQENERRAREEAERRAREQERSSKDQEQQRAREEREREVREQQAERAQARWKQEAEERAVRRKRATGKKAVIAFILVFLSIPLALIFSYFTSESPVTTESKDAMSSSDKISPSKIKRTIIDGWDISCGGHGGIDAPFYCSSKRGDTKENTITIHVGERGFYIAVSRGNDEDKASLRINDSPFFFFHCGETTCEWRRRDKHGNSYGLWSDIIPYMMRGGIAEVRYKSANGHVEEYKIQLGDFSKMYSVLEDAYQKHSHTKHHLVDLAPTGD